jgi:hypothetical protein
MGFEFLFSKSSEKRRWTNAYMVPEYSRGGSGKRVCKARYLLPAPSVTWWRCIISASYLSDVVAHPTGNAMLNWVDPLPGV